MTNEQWKIKHREFWQRQIEEERARDLAALEAYQRECEESWKGREKWPS